jgi:phosphoribosylglycinamide formyltransferase 2
MSARALERSKHIAAAITANLGGSGLFGVELFGAGAEVWFSEVSPRPHDTGLVTLISQDLSEFALHARAILGLPIPVIRQRGAAASCALLVDGNSASVRYSGVERALTEPDTALRLFGKPEVRGHRRMGVSLALGGSIEEARAKARAMTDVLRAGVRLD